jgi:hypothetical protein
MTSGSKVAAGAVDVEDARNGIHIRVIREVVPLTRFCAGCDGVSNPAAAAPPRSRRRVFFWSRTRFDGQYAEKELTKGRGIKGSTLCPLIIKIWLRES